MAPTSKDNNRQIVTVQVPLGLTPELQSCYGKVKHWVQLMCCPLARLLLQILVRGQRLDVWRLRNVGVVTRIQRSEWRKTKLITKLKSTGVVLRDYIQEGST